MASTSGVTGCPRTSSKSLLSLLRFPELIGSWNDAKSLAVGVSKPAFSNDFT